MQQYAKLEWQELRASVFQRIRNNCRFLWNLTFQHREDSQGSLATLKELVPDTKMEIGESQF